MTRQFWRLIRRQGAVCDLHPGSTLAQDGSCDYCIVTAAIAVDLMNDRAPLIGVGESSARIPGPFRAHIDKVPRGRR